MSALRSRQFHRATVFNVTARNWAAPPRPSLFRRVLRWLGGL